MEIIDDSPKHHKRGRPRKFEKETISLSNSTPANYEEKPREERSYKDFFPDLNIKEPLTIIKMNKIDTILPEVSEVKSPSMDEYETASEGESQVVEKKPTLPVVRFSRLASPSTYDSDTGDEEAYDPDAFHRPENHYIRYSEPSESELFDTVEYDMDEQDEMWLNLYNSERKRDKLGEVSGDLLESIIDKLEKEWFDLIKGLPKKTIDEPALPEDINCAICDDGECENSNAIVFCDGCNLAVHQDCYGIPYIPEGQWLCRKCMVSPENPVSCIFCPGEGGAFKQTTTNQWGHLLCAIWIPEVGLSNSVYMEPIDNIENVPKSRWKLTCYICKRRHGACIQCDNKHCFVAFHATCARWARLCMRMKLHGTHYDGVVLKAYCERHTPRDYKELIDVDKSVADAQRWFTDPKRKRDSLMPKKRYVDEEDDDTYPDLTISEVRNYHVDDSKQTKKQRRQQAVTQLLPASKAARAHQHQYVAGAPIAPEYLLEKLEKMPCLRQATHLKKKSEIITMISRYWSLKRESRRGAPLLKRLHLEPWTASSSQLKQSEVEKAQKASSMITLRADLERVRMLSEQVQRRERLKLEKIRKQKAYLEMVLYPIELVIQSVLDKLINLDKKELFRYPVTTDIASDYFDIVKEPMSFNDIINKLTSHRYLTLDEFEYDLSLIWKNSMIYNKADTTYFKVAQRLSKAMEEFMVEARATHEKADNVTSFGLLDVDIDPEIFNYHVESPLVIDTSIEEGNIPHISSSSERSSLDTLSSDSTIQSMLKRRLSESFDTPQKKKKMLHNTDGEEKKAAPRVTRSKSERDKRSLRSRSITKDMHHPVKTSKSVSNRRAVLETPKIKQSVPREVEPPKVKYVEPPKTVEVEPPKIKDTESHQVSKPELSKSNEFVKHSESTSIVKKMKPMKVTLVNAPPPPRTTRSRHHQVEPSNKTIAPNATSKEKPIVKIKMKKKSEATASDSKPVKFEHGEIVWARVRGFPPHPAQIIDPKKKRNLPDNVIKLKDRKPENVLVEFFEVNETHLWGWIEKKEIYPFGNNESDMEMLLQAKKTKKPYRIKEVKNGYIHACRLKNIDPTPQLEIAFKK